MWVCVNFLKPLFKKDRNGVWATDVPNQDVVAKLKYHPIFQEFKLIDNVKIDSLNISDPLKYKMAVCYLKMLYGNIEKCVCEMVEKYPEYCVDPSLIGDMLLGSVTKTRNDAVGGGIPSVFLNKYNPRTFNNINILTNIITEVHQRRMHSGMYDEMCSVLDVLLVYMRTSLESVEGLINAMNGELHLALVGSVFDN